MHSYGARHGEEDVLRGWRGSGTIFFSWCNLRCVFCQSWEISQKGIGEEVEPEAIAAIMLGLQVQGCHNISLVTPSHLVAQIIAAVAIAAEQGLRLPLVYNTGGYDMPDMKYGDSKLARKYSKVRDYVEVNRAAVGEMHRQVGDLVLDAGGLARRGLLVRHLVLPDNIAGTEAVLEFLAREISPDTWLNLMDQYYPCYRADKYPELARRITRDEYRAARTMARRLGLNRLDERHASVS